MKSCFRCDEYRSGTCKIPGQVIHRFDHAQVREAEEVIWDLAKSCERYEISPKGELTLSHIYQPIIIYELIGVDPVVNFGLVLRSKNFLKRKFCPKSTTGKVH